ncbi:TIGR01244 family sulfur transferase [Brevundimonas sp.]|uniref:TIGR01244 family sulfur transferase n=1 Tax=Brevundimonas sp. TaxID=1871086 RepID=UPI003D14CE61
MPFMPLSVTFSVAPQLTAADVAEAGRYGFRAIIDNRPDGEEPGQPTAAEMRALAASHGLGFAHVPTLGGAVSDEHVAQMAEALARLNGPVLAYCRTGTRAATLWALTQSGSQTADALIATAADAGYDLSPLRLRLNARRGGTSAAGAERAAIAGDDGAARSIPNDAG